MRQLSNIVTYLLLSLATPSVAVETTSDAQPVRLQADQAEINTQQGISIYRGNIQLQQGSLVIKGDMLVIHSREGKLQRAGIDGKPARFEYLTADKKPIKGEAPHLEYTLANDTLHLSGGTTLWQADNVLKGNEITYQLGTGVVNARSSDTKKDRIEILLYPDTLTPEKQP
jgi:lipopolysaccharide export system protein LptA